MGARGDTPNAAVAANQAVLDLDPENVDALLRQLRCRLERREYEAAVALAAPLARLPLEAEDKALLDRWTSEAQTGLERAQEQERRSVEGRRKRESQLASVGDIENFRHALQLGKTARILGDTELAIAYLKHGYSIARSRGDLRVLLAALAPALRNDGRWDEALAAYKEAIELEPSYERNKAAYTSLTATLRMLEQLDEARHHGEQLLRLHPIDPYVLNAVGAVYRALYERDHDRGLAQKAEECFREAERHSSEQMNPIRNLREMVEAHRRAATFLGNEAAEADAERLERHIALLRGA